MNTRRWKTLDRVLSKAGAGSRADAVRWVRAGRVKVDGRVVRDPDYWIDLERTDHVTSPASHVPKTCLVKGLLAADRRAVAAIARRHRALRWPDAPGASHACA